jgi:hypothetical protein
VPVAGVAAGVGGGTALLWGGYAVPAELVAPALVLNLAVGWSFIGMGAVARATRQPHRAADGRPDGVGGADPRGSRLRGLADRVAAVGGQRLHLSSPPGGGTRLRAELPCP